MLGHQLERRYHGFIRRHFSSDGQASEMKPTKDRFLFKVDLESIIHPERI